MSFKINTNGTWRTVPRMYVNVGGTWRLVQRSYVNQGGTWRWAFARTPGLPQNPSLVVNGSSNTNQTTNGSPVSATLSWSLLSSDSGLPVEVQWNVNGSPSGSPINITDGSTSTSTTFAISSGQSLVISPTVRVRNGQATPSSTDVYGSNNAPSSVTVQYVTPTVTITLISVNYSTDTITVSFSGNNAPSGAYYAAQWTDDSVHAGTYYGMGSTSGGSLSIGPGDHGYDLQQNAGDNYSVQFTFQVFMYNSSNQQIASATASQSYLVGGSFQ